MKMLTIKYTLSNDQCKYPIRIFTGTKKGVLKGKVVEHLSNDQCKYPEENSTTKP